MTYEQYWYGDPLMVRAFRKAEKLRQERQDAEAWLQGLYFKRALEASVGNVFLKKGQKAAEYPKLPLIAQQKEDEERERRQTDEEQMAFAQMWMIQFCEAGKNWGKK